MLEWLWPWAFILLPLPFFVRRFLPAASSAQDAALQVPFMHDFEDISSSQQSNNSKPWLLILSALAWIFLIIAAARPQYLGDPIELPVSGRDLMLAVDLSGSMQMEDFEINGQAVDRLTATKKVASEFIKRREGDRIGLILFGRRAYLQTPLSFDRKTTRILLNESAIGLAGKETAIGDAIGLAIKRLKDEKQDSRVLILLTDGANTAGEVSPIKAAELAAEQGLKIYTIGIGADEMVRYSIFGARKVNPSADLDEKTLRAIADKTGGQYFRARDTEALEKIYHMLDKLEPVEKDAQSFRPINTLYFWPLSVAFVFASLVIILKLMGFRK